MRKRVYLILFILFFASKPGTPKSVDSLTGKIENLPGNFSAKIQKKYPSVENRLPQKNANYLNKMQRQEKKLQRRILKADSGYITHENIDSVYSAFSSKLSPGNVSSVADGGSSVAGGQIHLNQYNPYIINSKAINAHHICISKAF